MAQHIRYKPAALPGRVYAVPQKARADGLGVGVKAWRVEVHHGMTQGHDARPVRLQEELFRAVHGWGETENGLDAVPDGLATHGGKVGGNSLTPAHAWLVPPGTST